MKKNRHSIKMQRTSNPRLALEPRIVFDAAVAATGADAVDHNSDHHEYTPPAVARVAAPEAVKETPPAAKVSSTDMRSETVAERSSQTAQTPVTITFIDASVEGIEASLVGRTGEVLILKAGQDGVDQIAAALAGRTNISAIHIVSHGSAGELELGTGILNSLSMAGRYAEDMAVIKSSLSAGGDILLYGCDAAADAKGATFVAQLARVTGADIEASTDITGSAHFGGNWVLESATGKIETAELTATTWDGRLNVAVGNGDGSIIAVKSNTNEIYSIDTATGKAVLLTIAPATVGGVSTGAAGLNSLATDPVNNLVYYVSNTAAMTNTSLFAYNYATNTHILIDSDLTNNGAGFSIVVGTNQGVAGGAAAYVRDAGNGIDALYFGVRSNAGGNGGTASNDAIYAIQFSANGTVVAFVNKVVSIVDSVTTPTTRGFGDISYDSTNNALEVIHAEGVLVRYNATTGAVIGTLDGVPGLGNQQSGNSLTGNSFFVSATIQQFDPVTGGAIAGKPALTINTYSGGTATAMGGVIDGASSIIPAAVVGDQIYFDNNNNGIFDAGDVGAAGVTVQLIDDINNDGLVSTTAGAQTLDRVLATDTTDANGNYKFTGVALGNYIVKVTDTGGVLGVNATHAYTQIDSAVAGNSKTAVRSDVDLTTIGQSILTADFGVKNKAPIANADTKFAIEDQTLRITAALGVLKNDTDADAGDTRTVKSFTVAGDAALYTAGQTATVVGRGTFQLNVDGSYTYTPLTNTSGVLPVVTYTIQDQTKTTASSTLIITVQPSEDPPVNSFPTNAITAEDALLVFSAANGNAISISDADGTSTFQTVTITVTAGTLSLSGFTNLTFTSGTGTNNSTMTVRGMVADINKALNGLSYKQVPDYNNTSSIAGSTPTISIKTVNDKNVETDFINGGFENFEYVNGPGAGKFFITNADNIPGYDTTASDNNIEIWGNNFNGGNGPVPAYEGVYFAELNATQASTLYHNFIPVAGSTFEVSYAHRGRTGIDVAQAQIIDLGADGLVGGTGVNADTVLAAQNASDGNAAWGVYTLTVPGILSGNVLRVGFTAVSSANNNNSTGNFLDGIVVRQTASDADTFAINVTPVKDTVPDSLMTLEDTSISFNPITGTNGASADNFEGVSPQITKINGASIAVGGSVAVINGIVSLGAGNVLTFTPAMDFHGAAPTVIYTVTSPVGVEETENINIFFTSVNDAPAGTDKTAAILEDVAYTVQAADFGFTDLNDSPANSFVNVKIFSVPVAATDGVYTLNGVVVKAGDIIAVSDIAAGQLIYIPALDSNGSKGALGFEVQDGGGTANGGADTDQSPNTLNFSITAVNDAPSGTDATLTAVEDTARPFTAADFGFTDPKDSPANALQSVVISTLPLNGTIKFNGVAINAADEFTAAQLAQLTFTAAPNASGAAYATFTFQLRDTGGTANGGADTDQSPNTITLNVTAVNDPPVANPDTAAVVESSVNPDGSAFAGIPTVGGNVVSNDTDPDAGDTKTVSAVNGQAGNVGAVIAGIYGSVNISADGSYTYTLDNTKAATQALSEGQAGTSEVFNYTVKDSAGATSSSILTVSVSGTNDASLLAVGNTLAYTENQAATAIDPNLTVSDVDNASLTGATVSIGAGFVSAEDVLAVVPQNGISGTYNAATGVLTLSGTATVAQYQTALRSVTYANTSENPSAAARAVNYVVNDGQTANNLSNIQASTVNVTPVNDAPVAVADVVAPTNEDTPAVIAQSLLLANDTDVDGDSLTVASVQGAVGGTVSLQGSNVVFTPTLNYNGPASFTYTVIDGKGGSATATVNLSVNPVNDNPVANADTASTPINTALGSINVLANDTDVDGNPLSATTASVNPAQGSVSINGDGTLAFTPATNFAGPAVISYSISDGAGGTASSTLTVNVGNNTPPTGADASRTLLEDSSYTVATGDFGFADADAGQTFAAVRLDSLQASGKGVLTLNGAAVATGQVISAADISAGRLVYSPAANGNGAPYASFNFSVQDSAGSFDTAPNSVTFNVTPVNDAPIAVNDTAPATSEDTPEVIAQSLLLANDTDVDGDSLTVASVQGAVGGTVSLQGSNVVFTPTLNYNGPASFTYTVIDGKGGSATATVNLSVNPVNDNPVAVNDIASTPINVPLSAIAVLANDSDVDANPLTVTSAMVDPAQGAVTINSDGTLAFTPANNFGGAATVTYSISDGSGGTASSTLTVNVGTNNPPDSANKTVTTAEDTPVTLGTADFAFADADAGQTLATVRIASAPANGSLLLNGVAVTAGQIVSAADIAGGKLSYTPGLNGNGGNYASFNFSVQDSGGAFDVAPNTITLNVTAVNDAPVAKADTVKTPEDTPLSIAPATLLSNDTDVEGATLSISSVQGAVGGTVSLVGGNVVFTPNANFNGPASFTYTISDGNGGSSTATVNVGVTPVNDPITADLTHDPVNDTGTSTTDNITSNASPAIRGTGASGDTITLYAVDGVTVLGTAVVGAGGAWSIDPAGNYLSEGVNPLSVKATDPAGNQGPATPVTVTLDTTAPTAPTVVIAEDANNDGFIDAAELSGPVDVKVSLPAGAKAGDTLSVTDGTTTNTIVLSAAQITAGNVATTFAPPGEGNSISVTARITNAAGNSGATSPADSAKVDTAPTSANPDVVVAPPRAPLVIDAATLTGNDHGALGQPLTIGSVQDAVNGTVAIVGGKVVFTPNPGFIGEASFTYTVKDDAGGSATASVSVTVLADDPPVLPSERFIDAPPPNLAGQVIVTDPSLHVLYSVNDVRVDTGLRSGLGLFQTDSATMAELTAESALALDNLTEFRPTHALFVQHAVRQEALVSETGIFVQNSVRASQLESLARNTRIDSFNSAISGVDTLLDPFALGAPVASAATPVADTLRGERQNPPASEGNTDARDNSVPKATLADQTQAQKTAADEGPVRQAKRRAADGFAAQLRRNTASFRTSAVRPETPLNDTARITR